jgi:hypothetical protein
MKKQIKTNHIPFFSNLFREFIENAYIETLHDCHLTSLLIWEFTIKQLLVTPRLQKTDLTGLSDPDCEENLLS